MMDYKQPKASAPAVLKEPSNREQINALRVSVGNMSSKDCPPVKTSGIKVRGTGAATKGTMARGPMG